MPAGTEEEPTPMPSRRSRRTRRSDGQLRGWVVTRARRDLAPADRRSQLKRIYLRDEATCWLCDAHVLRDQASRDHVVALKDGGGNADDNVRLAHQRCNSLRDHGEDAV